MAGKLIPLADPGIHGSIFVNEKYHRVDHTEIAESIAKLIGAMRVDPRIEAAAFGELDPPIGWLYWIGDETVVIRQDLAGVDPEENSQFLRQNAADIYLPALKRQLDQAGVAFSEELAGPGWLTE